MKCQALVEHGAPLQEINKDTPSPQGAEVIVRITHCGVCHSDVHLQDGYFGLGGDKKLDVTGAHQLPFILGHEIQGVVVAVGPDSSGVSIGEKRVIYPWIGCDDCPICSRGDEHLCNAPRALGVNLDGGYADHVMVPNARYLLDPGSIADGLAATYMCSGLTAYSALKKAAPLDAGQSVAIVGLGGVGMMGLQFARSLFPDARVLGVDIDDGKRAAALEYGANDVFDPTDESAGKALFKATGGGVAAAVDFVGAEASFGFANRAVAKGGVLIVVGLFGGKFSMAIPMLPLRAITIQGSYVGSLEEAHDMLEMVKGGHVQAIPIEERPLTAASQTLNDLRTGNVLGRVVLRCGG